MIDEGAYGIVDIGMFCQDIYRGDIELNGRWYIEIQPDDMDNGD